MIKDLVKANRNRLGTKQLILATVAALVFFATGLAASNLEGEGPVTSKGQALRIPVLAVPNPAVRAKPLRSFVCLSSWYGGQFDGQPTANGEIYDMYGQTAAHRSLPLGSVVRVVDLQTRRSAIVRINDRGPYVPGRGLDVSYQVARELGFARRGLAHVRVDLLKVPPSATTQPAN
jgi:rare lipoprotein A (peptidoglycan hydrolase)